MRQASARCSLLLLVAAGTLSVSGCRPHRLESTRENKQAETVHLAIVGDPALAEAIGRLKGEWHAVTGNTLEISEINRFDVASGSAGSEVAGSVDALIVSTGELGPLVETETIVPVPKGVRESSQAAWSDLFLLVQQGVTWGDDIWAVPFGSPGLTILYRRDLFEAAHQKPPTTWAEYQALVQFFSDRKNLGDGAPAADAPWHATLEPLAPGWAGRLLLSRAAAYAKHRDNYSTLFNIDTFEPLVGGPPFVRALTELVAAAGGPGATPKDVSGLDPTGAREVFFAGQSAMCLAWPTAVHGVSDVGDWKVGFAELPGATEMYNYASARWDDRTEEESMHVPVIPLEGRLGVVLKSSPRTEAAFNLLVFLSDEKWGTRVASASTATTLYRRSQRANVAQWVENGIDRTASRQYAQVVSDTMSRSVWVDALRIAGAAEYEAALDEAVDQARAGTATPSEALSAAVEKWKAISDRLGIDRQRAAYRRGLGLEP
jgi:multiple sugar transport system substrate-binding protein